MSTKPLIINGYTFLSKDHFAKGGEGKLYLVIKDGKTFVLKACEKKCINFFNKQVEIYKFISTLDIDIPKLIDSFEFGSFYVFVMEYIEESFDVTKLLRNADYELKKRFVIWLSNTIDNLHKHGVAHCDIKISNTLYSNSEDKFYLLDFGFSKYYNDPPKIQGTIIYFPPIICKNVHLIVKDKYNEHYDNRINDKWALGIVAYVIYMKKHFIYKMCDDEDDYEDAIADLESIPLTKDDFFDKFILDHCGPYLLNRCETS